MNKELSDKKKKELEELINESETEAVNYKKSLLPLGFCCILGGIVSFIAVPFAIRAANEHSSRYALGTIAICIAVGFIGCISGFYMIYNHLKLKKEEHPDREYVKHFE